MYYDSNHGQQPTALVRRISCHAESKDSESHMAPLGERLGAPEEKAIYHATFHWGECTYPRTAAPIPAPTSLTCRSANSFPTPTDAVAFLWEFSPPTNTVGEDAIRRALLATSAGPLVRPLGHKSDAFAASLG